MLTYYTVGGDTMRNDVMVRLLGLAASASLLVGVVGCGGEEVQDPAPTGPTVIVAPEYPEGAGQATRPELEYPAGPYGVSVGSVMLPHTFIGFANALENPGGYQAITLAEFYNPTGDGVYAEGSIFPVGSPKPKALLLTVSAVWCGPCNYEADAILPGEYEHYKPLGGEFFVMLSDGPNPGDPATGKHLSNWTNKYDVNYPMGLDPSNKLSTIFEQDAFPMNAIIDTRTMRIVEVIAGAPDASFWSDFDDVLGQ